VETPVTKESENVEAFDIFWYISNHIWILTCLTVVFISTSSLNAECEVAEVAYVHLYLLMLSFVVTLFFHMTNVYFPILIGFNVVSTMVAYSKIIAQKREEGEVHSSIFPVVIYAIGMSLLTITGFTGINLPSIIVSVYPPIVLNFIVIALLWTFGWELCQFSSTLQEDNNGYVTLNDKSLKIGISAFGQIGTSYLILSSVKNKITSFLTNNKIFNNPNVELHRDHEANLLDARSTEYISLKDGVVQETDSDDSCIFDIIQQKPFHYLLLLLMLGLNTSGGYATNSANSQSVFNFLIDMDFLIG